MIKPILPPFKNWALQNFPFIEDDFDAITNYQLYCKIVKYMKSVDTYMQGVDTFLTEVENYFNNLDVTEEINAKLDEMAEDGTLENLVKPYFDTYIQPQIIEQNNKINAQDTDITNFKNSVYNSLDSMSALITDLANNTPIAVTSTSDMTDTTKIYVNTTDGNWYYYDGDSWEIGGLYQSDGISDGSIDVLMLNSKLQANFNLTYSDDIEKGNNYQGYCKGTIGSEIIKETSSTSYQYFVISLEANEIYCFSGIQNYNSYALVITDSDDIVKLIAPYSGTGDPTDIIFRVNSSGYKAYISELIVSNKTKITDFSECYRLRKLTDIANNLKINDTIQELTTTANFGFRTQTTGNVMTVVSYNNNNIYCYAMEKGKTYKITGYHNYLYLGYAITDLSYKVIGSDTPDSSTAGVVYYTFTATSDGYIYVQTPNTETHPVSVEIINSALNIESYNLLLNKKIAYDGDSITQSRINQGNQSNGGAFAKIIADLTNSTYVNNATGGATISYKSGATGRCISRSLTNLPSNADIYVFSGGINDYWDSRPFGTLTSNYTDEVDDTTVIGALEKIFRYALTNFVGKPIIFVITHKVSNPLNVINGKTQFDLHDVIVSVCKKYSIPYYDAFDKSGLNGWNTAQKNEYLDSNASGTPDGTHPNEEGYKRYYVPELIALYNSVIKR